MDAQHGLRRLGTEHVLAFDYVDFVAIFALVISAAVFCALCRMKG